MTKRTIEFNDNSFLSVEIADNRAVIVLQARNYNKSNATTSASITLENTELIELINWIGEQLLNVDKPSTS